MGSLSRSISELRANERQWQVFCRQGHCVVLAPPGSGKTKLLVTCLAYDMFNRIPDPRGAACITYTTAAAEELRKRLARLGVPARSSLFVGTVHSFAINCIIRPFAALAGKPELAKASIAGGPRKSEAYRLAIDSVFGLRSDWKKKIEAIEFHRRRLSTEEEWAESGDGLFEAGQRYEELLGNDGLIDFEGVVAAAVELVEGHDVVRRVLSARYPRLYVDEYQDLAPGLDRLVRALCFGSDAEVELLAVGDPEQAIFSWTGTRPELLTDLAALPGVSSVQLVHNYRCGEEIIRLANRVQSGERTVTGDRHGGEVTAVDCPGGFSDQCRQAAAAVELAWNRGSPLHEIVVICPQKAHCREVAEVLRGRGVAVAVHGDEYQRSAVTSFVESCAAWAVLGREMSTYRLGSIHRRWRTLLGHTWTRDKDVRLTELLLSYQDMPDVYASRLLADLLGAGLHRAMAQPSQFDNADALDGMNTALQVGPLGSATVAGLADRARKVDRVNVTTMSSSKGLEFDVVLLLGADEELMPNRNSFDDPEKLQEERRKFYVSVTRARSNVKIFYSGTVVGFNGREKRTNPSRFLYDAGLLHR